MITYENECYIRIILLLLRTGREVIGKVIENVLRSKQMTLDALLILKKEEITVLEFITEQDKVSLFISSPELSEFSRWDISLLSFIALSYLDLSKTERELIEKTKNFWNTYLHISSRSIAKDDYTPSWTEINRTFAKYMYSLSDEEIKHLDDMTDSVCKQKDMDAAIEDLKNLIPIYGNCTALQKVIEDLEKMKQESGAGGVNDDPLSEDGEDLDISSNSKERNQDYTEFFTVAFQVLLAPNIKFNESQEKDTVVVRFIDDELGGPNSNKHKMEFKRKLPHSLHVEMEYMLRIPKKLVQRKSFIEYKYYVTRYSTTKNGKRRKPLNDLYYENGEADDQFYRKLTIPGNHNASHH